MTPQLLKAAVTAALNKVLAPIQAAFQSSAEWQEIEKKAYPPPPAPEKKKKKQKVQGTKYAGAKGKDKVITQPDGSVEGPASQKVAVGEGVEKAMEHLDVQK